MSDLFFASELPEVKLVGAISNPYDLSIATARTCYSSKGIITPDEVSKDDKAKKLRDSIAESTLEAGHLTTRQHAHFVFALNRVSRSFIWSFLHSHPFYNSEQVSQRYVKVKGNFTIPRLSPSQQELFEKTLHLQMKAYEELIQLLMPVVTEEYYRIFPSRKKEKGEWEKNIQKKAYEIARYVLPMATQAYLYHTVSALTLLRYYQMMSEGDTPSEQAFVIRQMIEEVVKLDPNFKKELRGSPVEPGNDMGEVSFSSAKRFCQEYDRSLNGHYSVLVDGCHDAQATLAQAVRAVLGKTKEDLGDNKAIECVLNPSQNKILGNTLNLMTLSKLTRTLFQVHFTFQKKISHTADSQDQRHRMTPGSRPKLLTHYFGEPDVIYPKLVCEVPAAKKRYEEAMEQTVEAINALLKEGVSFEKAHYLLPNAWVIRFHESGDLLNWHHKWKLRTCYNAQEEIFYASLQELMEVQKKFPLISAYIKAPCFIRKLAQEKPFCPEGDRYCGVPVWTLPLERYRRLI